MVKTIKWKKTNREIGKETSRSRGKGNGGDIQSEEMEAHTMGVIIGLHYTWIGGV
jgi:hypothetical protein